MDLSILISVVLALPGLALGLYALYLTNKSTAMSLTRAERVQKTAIALHRQARTRSESFTMTQAVELAERVHPLDVPPTLVSMQALSRPRVELSGGGYSARSPAASPDRDSPPPPPPPPAVPRTVMSAGPGEEDL